MTDFQLCMFLVLFSRKDSQIQKEQNFEMNLLYRRSVIRMMDMQITKRFSSSKMKRYRLGSSVCTRTVFLILLHDPSFLLEIRVIIKILSHPWYHINCDWFEKGWSKKKKIKMADSKKPPTRLVKCWFFCYVVATSEGIKYSKQE